MKHTPESVREIVTSLTAFADEWRQSAGMPHPTYLLAATMLSDLLAENERMREALTNAKWDFARIAQMHSIDDASDKRVADRCMAEATLGLEKVRLALTPESKDV